MARLHRLFDLTGKIAVVTGGSGKLGVPICEALAEAGAEVVIGARDLRSARKIAARISGETPGRRVQALTLDATREPSVKRFFAAIKQRFGCIDVLVNAAYSAETAPPERMTAAQFRSALDGALTSSFICSRAAARLMTPKRGGSIVNIGSIYGLVSPDARIYGKTRLNNPPHYGAAKAGVIQLTKWLATHHAGRRIRVNCVSPGGFYDPGLRKRTDYDSVFVKNYVSRTPLGRMGEPDDIKGAVLFLASDASRWVTGHNLVVDGGWTIW
ncbi:MAG TPA: SDR family oxidoreductase [Thermoplasmata archaeon]|nr:SDR family oxidoreductase [Thermoplasmata archaeon]